jgi:hypothetical protein
MQRLFQVLVRWVPSVVGTCFAVLFLLSSNWMQGAIASLITIGWLGVTLNFTTQKTVSILRVLIVAFVTIFCALIGIGVGMLVAFLAKWVVFGIAYAVIWLLSISTEALKILHISLDIGASDISTTVSSMNICTEKAIENVSYINSNALSFSNSQVGFLMESVPQEVCKRTIGDYISAGIIGLSSGISALAGGFRIWANTES